MKGDFTRETFRPQRHYWGVLRQQGRVDVDADWNEQVRIGQYQSATRTADLIGAAGGPVGNAGFDLAVDGSGDVQIGAGRFYVAGVLLENEADVALDAQPDDPGEAGPVGAGFHLAYLDVWDRHVTALDDPPVRETALGGPDTAGRARTVWQVRTSLLEAATAAFTAAVASLAAARAAADPVAEAAALQSLRELVNDAYCAAPLAAEGGSLEPGTGTMAARASEEAAGSDDPCLFEPGGGYRRLENRLYRVEIHDPGNDVAATAATYKWSRDNGSVVVSVEEFRNTGGGATTTEITVRRLGLDATQELKKDDWIEIVSDDLVAAGLPGQLVQIASQPDPADRILQLSSAVDIKDLGLHPQVRRWDLPVGGLASVRKTWRELEDGIEVRFAVGDYHTGDYWVIPARANTADVEWPPLPEYPGHEPAGAPEYLTPRGIEHRFAPIAALVHDGTDVVASIDLRTLFPPLTDVVDFAYVGGDGQEPVLPSGQIPQPLQASVTHGSGPVAGVLVEFEVVEGTSELTLGATTGTLITVSTDADGIASIAWAVDPADTDHRVRAQLLDDCGTATHAPVFYGARVNYQMQYLGGDGQSGAPGETLAPLQVWVSDGRWPVEGMEVEFTVTEGAGTLGAGSVITDANGFAEVLWTLDAETYRQQVEARLLDADGDPVHEAALRFTARVNYQLHYLSGDGQDAAPGETVSPLRVWVSDGHQPVEGVDIEFTVIDGAGTLSPASPVTTDADGVAEADWTLDTTTYRQRVQARMLDGAGDPVHEAAVHFNARVNYQLHFLSGDGQEAMPGRAVQPLRVWVSDGHEPVAGMDVDFTVTTGSGTLSPSGAVTTNADGIAEVSWTLDASTYRQQVQAQLVDGGGNPVHDAAVRFNANLSVASQVAYTPASDCTTLAGIGNVQDALDALCRVERGDGGCTISLVPGDAIEAVFASLGGAGTPDITICFAEGLYEIKDALTVFGMGHVAVSGVGRGTRIVAKDTRTVLRFKECASVLVRDLHMEAPADAAVGGAGVLDVEDCGAVTVEGVTAQCGSAAVPVVAAMSVHRSPSSRYGIAEPVRIRGCDVIVGEQQSGIVITNGARVHVEDNTVGTVAGDGGTGLKELLASADYRAKVVDSLIRFGETSASADAIVRGAGDASDVVAVSQPDWSISFVSPVGNQSVWAAEIAKANPSTEQEARAAALAIAESVLANEGTLGSRLVFRNWYRAVEAAFSVAGQYGIMVTGSQVGDVRVLNNTVGGVLTGIAVALEGATRGPTIGSLLIAGNTVLLPAAPVTAKSSPAISARDVDSAVVRDNLVQVGSGTGDAAIAVDGVVVSGAIGARLIVGGNHFAGTTVGARVAPASVPKVKRWVAVSNVATSGIMLDAPCDVREDGNVPPRAIPCPGDQQP